MKNNIYKICTYFIIYSIAGFIIETIFGIVTTGLFESRKSFLYGPFCGIYGVGAVAIIVFSKYFNKNNFTLFLGGYAIGTVTEYMISYLVETFLHTQWWNYTGRILNINGRVCLLYSIFWGILTVFLVKKVNPYIDKIIKKAIEKCGTKAFKIIILSISIFLIIDILLTCYAQNQFITRMVVEHNIEVENFEKRLSEYDKTKQNEKLSNIIEKYWNNTKMIKTFPNMKIEDKNNKTIYMDSLLPDIQSYYIKVFTR